MNKKGKNGFINHTGEYGATSTLYDCCDIHFYDNIEKGIYSTVKALVEQGFYTCSSCQGHVGFNETRTVTVQGEREDIYFLQYLIWKTNQMSASLKIRYILLPVTRGNNIYKEKFKDALKIQIIFGNCRSAEVCYLQTLFDDNIMRFPKRRIPYNELWEMYAVDAGAHVDIMY